jgi:neutral trehalase
MHRDSDPDRLVAGARAVLKSNDLGRFTRPAPALYPHQWNWDSCFVAIGIAHYDVKRAAEEIRSLLRGQWSNGMVPSIVFNPSASGYFPGPDMWQSRRSPQAPTDVETSGITDPPVLAAAARAIWERADDTDWALAFLREVYPKILAYHRFLHRERDPDGSGLVVVLHPWESGLDNAPPYLDAGSRVHPTYKPRYRRVDTQLVSAEQRPSDDEYDLFVWLLEQMRSVNWDQMRYLEHAQLQVEDVLFNSLLCQAHQDLAAIAEIVGEEPDELLGWRERTATAINSKLWDETHGTYYSFDRVADHLLREDTIAGLHPLFAGVPTPARAGEVVQRHLLDPTAYWPEGGHPIPTTSMSSRSFDDDNYWRGPTWVNTNWMILNGLRRYGHAELARELEENTLSLVASSGYHEYFDARTGEGYGTDNFSWTAALTLDLLYD